MGIVGKAWKAGSILAGGAAVGGAAAIAWSRLFVDHAVPLPEAIDAPRRTLEAEGAGHLSYYVDESTPGRPVLLLHSLNAAASAYEMRPLFEAFRGKRPVIAPDLPGFGFSERSARRYGPETYQRAIEALLARHAVSGGIDVIALSLSCEHAALAAAARPSQVRSLVLISPTGFASDDAAPMIERRARLGKTGLPFMHDGVLAQTAFDLLTTRPSLRFYLERTLSSPPTEDMIEQAYATSHQPGARHAALAFVRGELFVRDVEATYGAVPQPAIVLFDRDAYSDYAKVADWVLHHATWAAQRLPGTRGLPQFDAPDLTARAIGHWFDAMENLRHLDTGIRG